MHKLITVYDKTIRHSWKLCLSILIIFLFKAWYHEFWFHSITFIFLQFSSVTQFCPTLCNPMDCSMPGFPVHHQLPELAQIHVHQVGDAIQPFHSLSFPLLTSIFPSIGVFSNETVLRIRWPKYWSFSFGISPSSEYSGLISFRIDCFDVFAVDSQKSSPTLQFKSIKSWALSFLYGSTLTSIHDYWKNYSFD